MLSKLSIFTQTPLSTVFYLGENELTIDFTKMVMSNIILNLKNFNDKPAVFRSVFINSVYYYYISQLRKNNNYINTPDRWTNGVVVEEDEIALPFTFTEQRNDFHNII